jgi:5'-nucleotidase
MNILLTNDDGIDSPGILILAEVLKKRGDHNIFILAPDTDRSGVSHGLTFFSGPLLLREKHKDAWSCPGLPADCVIASVLGGHPCKPDIVIAGINRGANVGNDIIYSGTCAAARQAVLLGLPGIALSLSIGREEPEDFQWEAVSIFALEHLDEFLSLWENDIFLNVNFPNSAKNGGMVHTWPAVKNYRDGVSVTKKESGGVLCSFFAGEESVEGENGSDWDAVSRNLVSVSSVCIYPVVRRDLCAGVPDYAAAGKRGRNE